MKSMTGFGRCELAEKGVIVGLQASSVNRKNLEVICSLPKDLQQLERKVQEKVRAVASRGRFQFSIEVRVDGQEQGGLPSDEQLDRAIERLKAVADRYGAPFSVDAQLLVQVARLIEDEAAEFPSEVVEDLLLRCVDAVLVDLIAMRELEGEALLKDLTERRQRLAALVAQVKELAPGMVDKYRENLFSRLEQAGLEFDLGDERVLREIALFADRCDISEEITRLDSHLDQFDQLLAKSEPVGRPLEFLLQEVGREINTSGSKASSIEVSKLVLEMKNELERIREQVANVE
ncbi:YicC/YloC family endoribonuclease [Pelagicoccus sp. SDUM812003]|uniref:YicC/YloC family endoribonuclease n=1 Tax=Pelagicoccus sp. SDUM812003 TaxID=3041267 RepID=UPI00280CB602|nr:YicC/YloC family endoribonuclease [Pelagicoccus sp. SDUM812003]MDQ8202851.1 YicC family protein [Pelagicoccus sp. SDUM812003]